jgi:hypothetical protein
MQILKHLSVMMLVSSALSLSSQAQTTNYTVNEFNTAAEVTNSTALYNSENGWGNWFGGAFQSRSFDPTSDSTHNSASGSMKVVNSYSLNDYGQFVLFDGFYSTSINGLQFTNVSFDVRFAQGSCLRTNSATSLDFGLFQVGNSSGYGQDYFGSFAVPATDANGNPNTNWVHINIPINAKSDSGLTNITGLIFHSINTYYGNTYAGTQTFWVDNIVFVGAAAPSTTPPPIMRIQPASPGLRIFAGGTITYGRDELATVDQNQSWIGASGSASYSFKLLDYNPNIAQIHAFLIPTSQAGPNNLYNNIYIDYNASNLVCLLINPLSGSSKVTASVQWKTNLSGANPNHTDLVITNATAVGTWTLTFNGSNTGTLTAPGASPVPFQLSDPNAAADFGNPLVAYFGLQPNSGGGVGGYIDYGAISVTGVTGANENDNFTTDSALNTAIWNDTGYDTVLATANTPYWVSYTYPAYGFGLGVSDNITGSTVAPDPWMLPEYYNNYSDGKNIPGTSQEGQIYNWVLVPSSCLPTVDGQPQGGQAPAPDAFFKLFNPALSN